MGRLAGWTAVIVLGIGCVLLYTALLIPPPGHIDHSVLVAFGEICTFAGTLLGIGHVRRNNINRNKQSEKDYEKDR